MRVCEAYTRSSTFVTRFHDPIENCPRFPAKSRGCTTSEANYICSANSTRRLISTRFVAKFYFSRPSQTTNCRKFPYINGIARIYRRSAVVQAPPKSCPAHKRAQESEAELRPGDDGGHNADASRTSFCSNNGMNI